MRKATLLTGVLCAIIMAAGCDLLPFPAKPSKITVIKPPAGAIIVAKVGNFYITSDDLDKEVESFNNLVTQLGAPQNKIDSRDKKIEYLRQELVKKYMLYQEALNRGLENDDNILRMIDNYRRELLVSKLVRDELEKVEISDKDVRDYYDKYKEYLKDPEQRRLYEIMATTEEEAKQANIELLKGSDFSSVARQYSKSATSAKGGDLGYVKWEIDPKKRLKFAKFYEVAFSPTLESGDTSNIFKGPDGYYIVKVTDIKTATAKPYLDVKEDLKKGLLEEKQNEVYKGLTDKLQGETKIEIYEGKVD